MHNLKSKCFLFVILATTLSSLSFAEEPGALEGEWKVTSAVGDGKPQDAINFDGMRWVIGKDSLEITRPQHTGGACWETIAKMHICAGRHAIPCTLQLDSWRGRSAGDDQCNL